MLTVNRCPAQFEDVGAKRLVGLQLKLLLRVVANLPGRCVSGLHPVSPHHAPRQLIFNEQMIAEEIELIRVHAGHIGTGKTFLKLNIEDLESQTARLIPIFDRCSETQPVAPHFCVDQAKSALIRNTILSCHP